MSGVERTLWVIATGILLWYAATVEERLRVYNEQALTPLPDSCYAKDGKC